MENGSKVQIPEIGKQTMSTHRDERKGAGVGLLAKLGLGGGSAAGGSGGLAAGGGLLAGKAGVVALILAGSSVAAGIGMLTMGGGSSAQRSSPTMFARAEGEAAPVDSAAGAQGAQAAAASAGGVSGSLDNFNSANRGAVVDPYAPAKTEEASNPAEEQPKDSPAAAPDHTTTQSAGTAAPSGPAPKMVKAAGFGSGAGGGGGSSASGGGAVARASGAGAKSNIAGAALAGSSALRGGGLKGAAGARRSAIMRGGGAAGQLKAHSSALRGNLGSSHVSSAGSGTVMDGAGHTGQIGGAGSIAGGGQGSGGKGVDSSPGASTTKNLRDVSPPPAPVEKGKNVTSYQKEMMIAMGAMLGAMALIFISGMLSDKAKAASATPWVAAPLYAQAKNLAMMATALAAVATGIGVWLMMQKGQMMQGAMLTVVGGIMTFQAGKAWMTGAEAAKEAEAQSLGAANQMAGNTPGLQGATATSVGQNGAVTFSNGATGTMTPPASAAPGAGVVDSGYTLGNVKLPTPAPAP